MKQPAPARRDRFHQSGRLFCTALTAALLLPGLLAAAPGAEVDEPRRPAPAGREAPPLPELFDPDEHMAARDVRVGMTGYGLSVFKGTEIRRFEVEVIGLLRSSEQIATDIILIQASGQNLEHTGPIAGMSGSPIYLEGEDGRHRLVGAFAFGWPASKDPIAGVQPIEQMLRLATEPAPEREEAGEAGRPTGDRGAVTGTLGQWDMLSAGVIPKLSRGVPPAGALRQEGGAGGGGAANFPAGADPAHLQPLTVPLWAAGWPAAARQDLAWLFDRAGLSHLRPMDAPGGAAPIDFDEIAAGSSLIVPMLSGDLNLNATGTCTTVIGDRVFGFGHPLLGEGEVALPMAAGQVEAVIPTILLSFKMGTTGQTVGTLASDSVAGIAGRFGEGPATVPITLHIRNGESTRTFRFEAVRHPRFTPLLLMSAVTGAMELAGPAHPRGATRWDLELRYEGDRTVVLSDVAGNRPSGLFAPPPLLMALLGPLESMSRNPFREIDLESVEGTIELLAPLEKPQASLIGATSPRRRHLPGDTVRIDARFEIFRGGRINESFELELPADLEPGEYEIEVLDAAGALMRLMGSRPFAFTAADIDEVVEVVNIISRYPDDAVYLWLERPDRPGVAVGRRALEHIPASRSAMLQQSGREDVLPFRQSLTRRTDVPFILADGEATVRITVDAAP